MAIYLGDKEVSGGIGGILNMFYPVGSYYETSDTTFDPNVTWGGTWVLETEGQVHVSSGSNYVVSGALNNATDGGSSTVTLQISQIPSHSHAYQKPVLMYGTGGNMSWGDKSATNSKGSDQWGYSGVGNTGGDGAHNNMQPYIVVNRWHRTA